eukprot:CAMPEP_0178427846 /NCGR_PEP_ID=MMETSP0689_2-20121128/29959_1 /TAXON_ID=160604 /ORGANISM="Amphidinium massartii, Strain CS-259" /LENGTH=482 /DNA_ID=CAMNT_0020049573 /DNA_START=41 /DNA_END=1489 /DNA_ORIENTATION=+
MAESAAAETEAKPEEVAKEAAAASEPSSAAATEATESVTTIDVAEGSVSVVSENAAELAGLSGARIEISDSPPADGKKQVTIRGTDLQVGKAKVLLEERIAGGAKSEKPKPSPAPEASNGFAPAVTLAGREFATRDSFFSHIKKMQSNATDGAQLGQEDSFLLFHVATYHPNFQQKMVAPVTGFKYATHPEHTANKCFWITFADGSEDALSISKCTEAMFLKRGEKRAREESRPAAQADEEEPAAQRQKREIVKGCVLEILGIPPDWDYQSLREKMQDFEGFKFLELFTPNEGAKEEKTEKSADAAPMEEADKPPAEEAAKDESMEEKKEEEKKDEEMKEEEKKEEESPKKEEEVKAETTEEGKAASPVEAKEASKEEAEGAGEEDEEDEGPPQQARARFFDADSCSKAAKELTDLDGTPVKVKILEGEEEQAFWERLWKKMDKGKGKDGKDGKGKGGKGKGKGKDKDKGKGKKKGGKGKKK